MRSTLLFNDGLNGAFSYGLCALRMWSCPAADPEEAPGLCKSAIAPCRRHAYVLLAEVLAALLILGCSYNQCPVVEGKQCIFIPHCIKAQSWALDVEDKLWGE